MQDISVVDKCTPMDTYASEHKVNQKWADVQRGTVRFFSTARLRILDNFTS